MPGRVSCPQLETGATSQAHKLSLAGWARQSSEAWDGAAWEHRRELEGLFGPWFFRWRTSGEPQLDLDNEALSEMGTCHGGTESG